MRTMDIDSYYRIDKKRINTIYHYTSSDAIINIINNRCIRFTNCLFLNDSNEFNYFKDVVDELSNDSELPKEIIKEIKHLKEYIIDDNHDSFIDSNKNGKSLCIHNGEYYIFSCTVDSDSLPMWNYYVKNSTCTGYSLEINKSLLIDNFKDLSCECIYGKIVYNKKDQKKFIINYIKKALNIFNDEMSKLNVNDDEYTLNESYIIDDYQEKLYSLAKYIRLFFKDIAFHHEKEYRIVLLINSKDNIEKTKKGYFSKNGVITPYIEIKLDISKFNPFKGIVLSPLINTELSEKGILDLINNVGIDKKKFRINKSKIMIRY